MKFGLPTQFSTQATKAANCVDANAKTTGEQLRPLGSIFSVAAMRFVLGDKPSFSGRQRTHRCRNISDSHLTQIFQTYRLQLVPNGRLPERRRRVALLLQPPPRVLPVGFVEPPGSVLSLLPAPGASVPAGRVQAAEVPHDESLDQQDGQSGDQQGGLGAPGQPAGTRVTVHRSPPPPSGSSWEPHPLNADSGVWMLPYTAWEGLLAGREEEEEEEEEGGGREGGGNLAKAWKEERGLEVWR